MSPGRLLCGASHAKLYNGQNAAGFSFGGTRPRSELRISQGGLSAGPCRRVAAQMRACPAPAAERGRLQRCIPSPHYSAEKMGGGALLRENLAALYIVNHLKNLNAYAGCAAQPSGSSTTTLSPSRRQFTAPAPSSSTRASALTGAPTSVTSRPGAPSSTIA